MPKRISTPKRSRAANFSLTPVRKSTRTSRSPRRRHLASVQQADQADPPASAPDRVDLEDETVDSEEDAEDAEVREAEAAPTHPPGSIVALRDYLPVFGDAPAPPAGPTAAATAPATAAKKKKKSPRVLAVVQPPQGTLERFLAADPTPTPPAQAPAVAPSSSSGATPSMNTVSAAQAPPLSALSRFTTSFTESAANLVILFSLCCTDEMPYYDFSFAFLATHTLNLSEHLLPPLLSNTSMTL